MRRILLGSVLSFVVSFPAAALAGPTSHSQMDEEEDTAPPTEPFADGSRAFQAAKEQLLKGYYRDTLTEDDLYRAAVQGMLERVDPALKSYNRLLSPKAHQALQDELKGQIIGIGVEIKIEEDSGLIDVLGVIAGSPAMGAGLAVGDRIVTVDGKSFKGQPFSAVVSAIRGQAGESVRFEVIHNGQIVTKSIRRGQVVWDPVRVQSYAGGIFQLSLSDFNERTPEALRQALAAIVVQNPKGLVIDLRHNHGGLLDQAISAAKLLLPAGTPIAQIVHRGGKVETLKSDGAGQLPALPAVLLVDSGTMSSAELLAAALRGGLHAPLIGATTKGKWSIQTLEELPNHYVMKYTVGAFRTPDGKSFEGTGLTPDVEVALDPNADESTLHLPDPIARLAADAQLRAAVNLLRMRP